MSNLETICAVLKSLYYGKEVAVKDKGGEWLIHWFERISSNGFCTTEGQGKAYRFIKTNQGKVDFQELLEQKAFASITKPSPEASEAHEGREE